MEILSLLATSTDGYALNEIAKLLDAPRTSLYPIVQTMLRRNFISLNKDTSRYRIGYNTYATGNTFLEQYNSYSTFLEEMQKVTKTCGEMCQLGVLDEGEVLYIGKVDSPAAIRTVSHVGKKLPAHCTALGKALIHKFSREELDEFFTGPLVQRTPKTITDLDVIYSQILTIRETQVAFEAEETQTGIICYAVPICQNGITISAISLSIPLFRATDALQERGKQALLQAKSNIELLLSEMPVSKIDWLFNRF